MRIDLSIENQWRPADWRWQRATLIANNELRSVRRLEDAGVIRAIKLAKQIATASSRGDAEVLAFKEPAFYWAYDFFQSVDPARRAELEARVLSGDTIDEISVKVGLSKAGVHLYESLFFDVRTRLKCTGFILHSIMGEALHRGFKESDYPLLWKFYGYTYGPRMLDSMISQAVMPHRPRNYDEVRYTLQDDGHGSILRKQAIAARTVAINSFNQIDVMAIYSKFVEIDRLAGQDRAAASGTLLANVQAALQSLPLQIGSFSEGIDGPIVAKYDDSSTELTSQQLILERHNSLPAGMDSPPGLVYPERTNHARVEQGSSEPDSGGGG